MSEDDWLVSERCSFQTLLKIDFGPLVVYHPV